MDFLTLFTKRSGLQRVQRNRELRILAALFEIHSQFHCLTGVCGFRRVQRVVITLLLRCSDGASP